MTEELSQSIGDDVEFASDPWNSEEQYPLEEDDLPIHKAAAEGDISSLASLVASKGDVNTRNSSELTPLHLAIHGNHAEAVRILLSAGADPSLEEVEPCYQQRYTAINLAAYIGSQDALAMLIDQGVEIPALSLYLAASVSRVGCIDTILQKLGQRDFPDSSRGVGIRDALIAAARCCHSEAVDFFLTRVEGFPDKENKEDRDCLRDALWSAIHDYDCDDRCRWSDKLRADPRLYYKMMENLIAAGADVNMDVPQIWMSQSVIEFLLQNGLRVDHAHDGKHMSLLSIIWNAQHDPSLIEAFLERGAKATITDTELNTPLHFAAQRSFAELLFKHGADLFARNVQGKTPLHSACEQGRVDVVEFLVANGAGIDETTNDTKWTPLIFACGATHNTTEDDRLKIARLLITHEANVRAVAIDGRTALHAAANRNDTELVRYLIEQGADIQANTVDGETVLHSVFSWGGTLKMLQIHSIVELLLNHGAKLETKDKTGATPLYLSYARCYPFQDFTADTFNLLIQKGANKHALDNDGKTVLDLIDRKKWQFDEQGMLQAIPQPQFLWQGAGSSRGSSRGRARGRGGGRGGGRGVS